MTIHWKLQYWKLKLGLSKQIPTQSALTVLFQIFIVYDECHDSLKIISLWFLNIAFFINKEGFFKNRLNEKENSEN